MNWRLAIYFIVLTVSILMIIFSMIVLLQVFFNVPPFFPSFNKNIKKAIELTKAELEKKRNHKLRFIDLGSGDGRIVFLASQLGFEADGVDINPFLWIWCNFLKFFKNGKTNFKLGSYFNQSLHDYDVVFVYLFPGTMHQLEEKIFSELKPGSLVISHQFHFKRPVTETIGKNIHLYRV